MQHTRLASRMSHVSLCLWQYALISAYGLGALCTCMHGKPSYVHGSRHTAAREYWWVVVVDPDGWAADSCIVVGDLLLEVDDRPVKNFTAQVFYDTIQNQRPLRLTFAKTGERPDPLASSLCSTPRQSRRNMQDRFGDIRDTWTRYKDDHNVVIPHDPPSDASPEQGEVDPSRMGVHSQGGERRVLQP